MVNRYSFLSDKERKKMFVKEQEIRSGKKAKKKLRKAVKKAKRITRGKYNGQ